MGDHMLFFRTNKKHHMANIYIPAKRNTAEALKKEEAKSYLLDANIFP